MVKPADDCNRGELGNTALLHSEISPMGQYHLFLCMQFLLTYLVVQQITRELVLSEESYSHLPVLSVGGSTDLSILMSELFSSQAIYR